MSGRRRSWEERLLTFELSGWQAGPPKYAPTVLEALPWTRPDTWSDEAVCLGLSSFGTVQFLSQAGLLRLVMADRFLTGPLFAEGALIHRNRVQLTESFLADEHLGNFLLMIDGDTVVAPDLARALVTAAHDLELDVVSQTYPTLAGTGEAAVLVSERGRIRDVKEPEWGTLVQVDMVGAGCTLIRRSLLVAMTEEYGDEGQDALWIPLADREDLGEDFMFCLRARWVGARIASANLSRVRHLKVLPLVSPSQAALRADLP